MARAANLGSLSVCAFRVISCRREARAAPHRPQLRSREGPRKVTGWRAFTGAYSTLKVLQPHTEANRVHRPENE